MATDVMVRGADEPDGDKPTLPAPSSRNSAQTGFFTVYKRGQGYWTRMGTAFGVILLLAVTAWFVYSRSVVWLPSAFYSEPADSSGIAAATAHSVATAKAVGLGLSIGITLVGAFFAWRLMNRPSNADFLIATDTEMKKVNWTSRAELIGSTKVVIFFMFLIAAILFFIDIFTGWIFYLITVLKTSPFNFS